MVSRIRCRLDEFRCSDGRCIKDDLKCNGRSDCTDGTDESSCPVYLDSGTQCKLDEFRCSDGRCIKDDLKCNGRYDCTDGFDELSCSEGFCNLPHPLANGTILELESTNQTRFPYNFQITYVCKEGFRLDGESWNICKQRGWSSRWPRCKIIQCPDPGIPENGTRKGDNYTTGSSVHFSCSHGYDLLGSVRRSCMPNGQWTGEVARCNLPSNYCPNLGVPIRGVKSSTNCDLGSKVRFHCPVGSIQLGSEVRECLSDHTWSGTETKCLELYDFDNDAVVRDRLTTAIARIAEEQREELAKYELKKEKLRNGNLNGMVLYPGRIILYFVFDVSRTVGAQNFAKSIEFAKAIVKKVGISENGARAGALTFSSTAEIQFIPSQYNTTERVLNALNTIDYRGHIGIESAFSFIRRNCIPHVNRVFGERNVKSVIFLLTDGKANIRGNPVVEAEILKRDGVEIHCIGITGNARRIHLYGLASKSKNIIGEEYPNVYILQNYATLSWLVQEITNGTVGMQCYTPPTVENAKYDIKHGVNEVATLGSSAVYTCKEGYKLTDTEVSTLYCDLDKNSKNVKWTGELPSCKANIEIGCEVPNIVNGEYGRYVDYSFKKVNKTVLIENKQTLTLRCHEDYVPFPRQSNDSGEGAFGEEIICENGMWSKNLSCVDSSSCSYAPSIGTNEPTVSGSHQRRRHGDVVTYEFWVESILVEKGKAVCHLGKWIFSSEPKRNLTVESVSCAEFALSPGLQVSYSKGGASGSIATFTCSGLTILEGNSQAICLSNGTWNKSPPFCRESITCPMFESPQGIEVIYTADLFVGSHAIFKCSGKILQGNTYAVCQSNGTWSHTLPTCKEPVFCQMFEPRPSLEISYTNGFSIGSKASFICSHPSVLDGVSEATCMANGLWSHSLPRCLGASGCILKKPDTSVLNIAPVKPYYKLDEQVIVWCPGKMVPSRYVGTLTCLGTTWSDDLPDCIMEST